MDKSIPNQSFSSELSNSDLKRVKTPLLSGSFKIPLSPINHHGQYLPHQRKSKIQNIFPKNRASQPRRSISGSHQVNGGGSQRRIGSEEVGRGEGRRKKKRKREKKKRKKEKKKKYRDHFSIIRKFDRNRVPSYNLRQLEGTFLLFFKIYVHFCNFIQLEGTKMQLSLIFGKL